MFKIGDKVAFLDEPGEGEVLAVNGDWVTVRSDTGFDEDRHVKELVSRGSLPVDDVQPKDLPKGGPRRATKMDAPGKMEVDLHFDKLVDFPKNYDNFQMLQIQMREAHKALERAHRGGIKKVIIIHGVGQGRLREEIHTMLERMDRLTFYDASFAEYGRGATEVELF